MEALYYRYREWVLSLAVRFCGNEADALDVLQQAFIDLFRRFPGFELRAQMKTFLYPVVRHLALDVIRKRRPTEPIELHQETLAAPGVRDPAGERRELSELLARLSEEQREVVLLRFADGLSLAEISEALAIPLGTVKSRLHHALSTLRTALRKGGL